jgi:hypothetical protein
MHQSFKTWYISGLSNQTATAARRDAGAVDNTPESGASGILITPAAELDLLIIKGTALKDLIKSSGSHQFKPTRVSSNPRRFARLSQKPFREPWKLGKYPISIVHGFVIVCNLSFPGISRTLYRLNKVIQSLKILGSFNLLRWSLGIILG